MLLRRRKFANTKVILNVAIFLTNAKRLSMTITNHPRVQISYQSKDWAFFYSSVRVGAVEPYIKMLS
jgi:hypothetical protein